METKHILQSKTIIAILIAIVVSIAQHFGYNIGYTMLDSDSQSTISEVLKYSSLGIAIVARVFAKHTLTIGKTTKNPYL